MTSPTAAPDALAVVKHRGAEAALRHVVELPGHPGSAAPWPEWAHPALPEAFARKGVRQPWSHQAEAAEAAHRGRHVVLTTGTASGKSLAFQLPALDAVLRSRRPNGRPGAGVLYLSPTKALAQDQLASLATLEVPRLAAVTHDGDSSREQRDWARDHAEWLLTNPDMLHHSLLPDHRRWARLFSQLRYVVVDECHHYRGVFGAHVALVLRRLRRLAAQHGAEPVFVLASATVAEPEVLARRLTGLDAVVVARDGSRRGPRTLCFWQPPFTEHLGEDGAPLRRSAAAESADLLADLVSAGSRTLAFVRSRRGAELVARTARRHLEEVDPDLAGAVAAYRGGYLPEDRRALEAALRSGRLRGLAATTALELGIDVAGLDTVLLTGFPGTRAAFWQQAGRAGRAGDPGTAVLIARDDPLDGYLVDHPELLTDHPVEAAVFDPTNPHVLGPHLCAAAAESPLRGEDLALFGGEDVAGPALSALEEHGLLRRRAAGWFWTERMRAGDLADLRSTGGAPVHLLEEGTGRVLGTVDGGAADHSVHRGAVYLHQGETYLVRDLDLAEGVAHLSAHDPGYTTFARQVTDIAVVAAHRRRPLEGTGGCTVHLGTVQVTHQVVSFLKRAVPTGEVLAEEPLDLPARRLETTGVWWTVPDDALARLGLAEAALPGAAHAAEHAAIGLLPLLATCDRWDIGGVSTARHPDTGTLTVFVYDGHPGGAGFSERGFEAFDTWVRATRDAIAACPCPSGCPGCVQSPKCGNGNEPLDKQGAVVLLDALLGR